MPCSPSCCRENSPNVYYASAENSPQYINNLLQVQCPAVLESKTFSLNKKSESIEEQANTLLVFSGALLTTKMQPYSFKNKTMLHNVLNTPSKITGKHQETFSESGTLPIWSYSRPR